jgi:copper chaperone
MTYSFKTDINCLGCVHEIKPNLDKLEESQDIEHWKVDLNSPDNILTIETNNLTAEEVETVIQTAGFKAQPVQ